jgi:multicomponent Na+:H+ antiporter subunit A
LLHGVVLIPLFYTLLVPGFFRKVRHIHTGWFVLPVPILLFSYLLSLLPLLQQGQMIQASIPWIPSLGIDFSLQLDGLSMLFSLLISGIGVLVVLYSIFYLSRTKEALHHFYVYLLLFMGAMLGVVLSDNLIVLYGFWELTSLSSFMLIAYWYNRERSLYGAQKSMLITVFGGLAMLAGIVLLYVMTGTFSVRSMIAQAELLSGHELFIPAMLLILLGAFTKSAQFPFHIWLPDAMEAPTPVSAYLHSATMVKAGLYLVARLTPVFAGGAEWFWIVTSFGLVTLLWGSITAVKQTDLKALLAYSTVSQLGLIMCLMGVGSAALYVNPQSGPASAFSVPLVVLAMTAAVFHLINHATFKGALFMVAGIIDHETGTRDIRKLGGLLASMPITFTFALIGTFSMAGIPPFNGFLSKEMFFTGMLNATKLEIFNMQTWALLLPIVAWVASVFTFIYSMIFVFRTFTGKFQPELLPQRPHEAPLGLLISPAILVGLVIVFGLFPNLVAYTLIEPALSAIYPGLLQPDEQFLVKISLWHGWTPELFMTAGVIGVGTLLYRFRHRWHHLYKLLPEKLTLNALYDWGLSALERHAYRWTTRYMTGSIRHYLSYIFVLIIVMIGFMLVRLVDWSGFQGAYAPIALYEVILIIVLLFAAASIPFVRSRLRMIVLAGVVGYMVSLFFVIFRAPDLALTQIIVETVSVVLFLLCFYHLPKLKQEVEKLPLRLTHVLISIGVGAVITGIALSAMDTRLFPTISDYYLQESYASAGGNNVVNVILVDFRGFDTLLEIMVLGIAALGIFSLIRLRQTSSGKESTHENE